MNTAVLGFEEVAPEGARALGGVGFSHPFLQFCPPYS